MSRHPFEHQRPPTLWDATSTAPVPDTCFADETAIDFPAVGQLVARVRDAFLGEAPPADVLTTEVSLSRRDASVGTVVPLAVPVRETCRPCGGRGELWAEPCDACQGAGSALVRRAVRFSVPAGVAHGARFRFRVNAPDAWPVKVEVRVAIRPSAA